MVWQRVVPSSASEYPATVFPDLLVTFVHPGGRLCVPGARASDAASLLLPPRACACDGDGWGVGHSPHVRWAVRVGLGGGVSQQHLRRLGRLLVALPLALRGLRRRRRRRRRPERAVRLQQARQRARWQPQPAGTIPHARLVSLFAHLGSVGLGFGQLVSIESQGSGRG